MPYSLLTICILFQTMINKHKEFLAGEKVLFFMDFQKAFFQPWQINSMEFVVKIKAGCESLYQSIKHFIKKQQASRKNIKRQVYPFLPYGKVIYLLEKHKNPDLSAYTFSFITEIHRIWLLAVGTELLYLNNKDKIFLYFTSQLNT